MSQRRPHSRLVVATEPVDFRQGLAGLAAVCRHRLGDNPLAGAGDVFRNRSGTALTLWLYDGQGSWMLLQRLAQGRVRWWPTSADARVPLSARELSMVRWHGPPERAQMARAWRRVASGEARRLAEAQGSHAAGSAQTAPRCSCRATRSATALPPAYRQGAMRLGSPLAIEALGGLWYNREFCRCRMPTFKARSARVLARGAPGTEKNRVRGTQ